MMKKKYTNMESRGLPGGPNEVFTYITGVFSSEGYRENSPDVDNLFNIISSNSISMLENDGTPLKKGPIMGIDNLGNKKMMYPGGEYKFKGDQVLEIPMAEFGVEQLSRRDRRRLKKGKWVDLQKYPSKYNQPHDSHVYAVNEIKTTTDNGAVDRNATRTNVVVNQFPDGTSNTQYMGRINDKDYTYSTDNDYAYYDGERVDVRPELNEAIAGMVGYVPKKHRFDRFEPMAEVNTFDQPVTGGGRDFTTHFVDTSLPDGFTKNYMTNRKGEITGQAIVPAGKNYNTRQLYRKYKRGKVQGEDYYDGKYANGGTPMAQNGNGEKGKAKGNPFADWWYNLSDVQDKYEMFNDLDGAWLSEWMNHPETIKRLQNQEIYNIKDGKTNEEIRREGLLRLSRLPVYDEERFYGWNTPLSDNYISDSDLNYNNYLQGFPRYDASEQLGQSFMDGIAALQDSDMAGFYNPLAHYVMMNGINDPRSMGILAHEGVHATGPYQELNENAIRSGFGPTRPYDESLDIYGALDANGNPRLGSEYLDDDGLYPRIMDIRRRLGVKPGDQITEKMLDDAYDNDGGVQLALEQLSQYYTPEQILNMFNTLANNNKELHLDKALYGYESGEGDEGGEGGKDTTPAGYGEDKSSKIFYVDTDKPNTGIASQDQVLQDLSEKIKQTMLSQQGATAHPDGAGGSPDGGLGNYPPKKRRRREKGKFVDGVFVPDPTPMEKFKDKVKGVKDNMATRRQARQDFRELPGTSRRRFDKVNKALNIFRAKDDRIRNKPQAFREYHPRVAQDAQGTNLRHWSNLWMGVKDKNKFQDFNFFGGNKIKGFQPGGEIEEDIIYNTEPIREFLDKALFGNKERRRKKRGDLYLTREQLSQQYPGREHLHQDKLSPEDRVFGNNMAGITDETNRLRRDGDVKYELPIKFDDEGNTTGVGQYEGGYGVRTRKGDERTNTVNFPLTEGLATDLYYQKEGTGMPLVFAPEVNVGAEKPSWIPKGGLDRATVNLMNTLSSEDQFKDLSREELYKTIKSGEAQKFIDNKADSYAEMTGNRVKAGKTREDISTAERVWDVITNVGDYTNTESRNALMNSSMTANEINQAKANNTPGFEDALNDPTGVGDVIDMFNPLAIVDNMTRSIQDERYSDAVWDGIGLIPATKVSKIAKPIQTLLRPVGSTIQKGLNIAGDTKVGNVATNINKVLKYDPISQLSQASTNFVPAPIQKTAEFITNSKAPAINTWNFLTGKGIYGAALGDNESFGEDYKFSKSSPGRIGLNIADHAGLLPDNVKQNVQEELDEGIKASDVGKVLLNTVDPTIGKAIDFNPYVSKTIFKGLDTFLQGGGEPDIENIVNTREFNIPSLAKSLYGNKDQVIALQNALVDAGFDIGKSGADGIFGPNTTKAYTDYISSASEFDPRVSSYNSIISNIQSDDVSPLVSLAMEKAGRDFKDEEMAKLKSVFERVNMSSKAISEIMGGIDTEWLESATAGILGTESRLGTYASDGILKADPFDQKAKNNNPYSTMPAFELGDLKVAIQNLVGMDDAEKSLGIAKTKFENIDPEERAYLNITSPQDLLDPQKSIDLTILSLAKRYNRLKSYSSQFPELNMTEDDIRNLAILGHNEGDDAQSQTRFGRYMKNGDYNPKTIAEELHSMRSLFNPDSKTKDFSSSYYKHIPGGGKLFDWFGSESPTYIANVKNYMDQLYGNVKNKTMSGLRYDPEQKAYVKKEGGEKDADINEALKIYKDFFNNKYKGNPLEPMAKRFEELLNRKFWPKAKQNKMSPANYIMSNMP